MHTCKVILVRHGQTYWNAQRKIQGQVNVPLDETGIRQAGETAEKLKDRNFDFCFSSPLSRARKTAEIILKGQDCSDIDIHDEPLLLEQAFGVAEGFQMTSYDYDPDTPINAFETFPKLYQPAIGAEKFEDVMERGRRFLKEVLLPQSRHSDNILVAAHGSLLSAVCNVILDRPLEDYWDAKLPNCGIAEITINNGRIAALNLKDETYRFE